MPRILVVDNYDSFVHILVHYLQELGANCVVRRNDDVTVDELLQPASFDGVLISPGPGRPEEAGASLSLIFACVAQRIPLLGVCLGHQAIAVAFGGKVDRASEPRHGKTSLIEHDNTGVLTDMPNPFTATRYHSLIVAEDSLPAEGVVNGRAESGEIMAIRHSSLPIHGVQFHPESVLTQFGHLLLANWLAIASDTKTNADLPFGQP